MAIIQILPEIIANQIAAGEVVNRPASVVKELMENAIDAGATEITLIIKDAGKTLVQVLDNGCGMDADDARLCFVAHATSKIKTSDDLYALTTMGFRGEALASIAAISFVELRTRKDNDAEGLCVQVLVEGGQIKSTEQVQGERGTSISVKNLFFNTPARRSFLKADSVENGHIKEEFIKIALFYKDIAFTYYNDNEIVYKLERTSSFRKRIMDIFGKKYNEKILPMEEETDLVKISGFISKTEIARKKKDEQYFFVNGRFMRNNYFANAIERAYIGLVPERTYPVFFINLNVNPKNIDVNIHPTKTEVKFLDEKFIYSILYATTKRCLGQFSLETEIDWNLPTTIEFSAKPTGLLPKLPALNYNPNYNPFNPNKQFEISKPAVRQEEILTEQTKTLSIEINDNKSIKPYQIAGKYIIVPHKDNFAVINQQRASFKVLYENFISTSHSHTKGQQLLFPYNHFFNPAHSFRILEVSSELAKYGFELEYKADGSFDITAAPSNLTYEQSVEAIEEFLDNIDIGGSNKEEQQHKIAISFAKRLCVKSGEILNEEQINVLLAHLYATPNCEYTPLHERIITRIFANDLDNLLQ
jgi:DNA mismatch repair protein MutL